jgi:hypothetical protein
MACFTKVYLYVKNPDEDIYKHIAKIYNELGAKNGRKMLVVSSNINDVVDVPELDENETNLIVIDDMLTEMVTKVKGQKTGQQKIRSLCMDSRKKNTSVIYVSQSYYDTEKLLRKSANYIFIKRINTDRDLKGILREYKVGIPEEEIISYYKYATQSPNDFFLIDLKTNDPHYRFRKDFSPII